MARGSASRTSSTKPTSIAMTIRLIWHHISRLINLSRPADVVTVNESIASVGKSEEVGGLGYLNALAHNTPSAANIRRYAEIVRERSMLRKLVTVADEIAATAFNPQGKEARQLLDEAESKVFKIAQEGAKASAGFREIQPLLSEVSSGLMSCITARAIQTSLVCRRVLLISIV